MIAKIRTTALLAAVGLSLAACATDFGTEEWATLGPLTILRNVSQNMAGDNTYTYYAFNPTNAPYCVYRTGQNGKRSVMVGAGQRVAVYEGRATSPSFAAEAPEDLGQGPYCSLV